MAVEFDEVSSSVGYDGDDDDVDVEVDSDLLERLNDEFENSSTSDYSRKFDTEDDMCEELRKLLIKQKDDWRENEQGRNSTRSSDRFRRNILSNWTEE